MAGNTTPIFPGTVANYACQVLTADGTNLKTLCTAPANGVKLESLAITSNDTVSATIQLVITLGGVDYVVGEIPVAIAAGTNGATKAVNGFNLTDLPWMRTDEAGRPYLYLASGAVLKVKAKSALTASKAVQFFAQAGDF
jgi:hypothetical protein